MGNRIFAACTALLYGEIADRKVVIDWRDGSYTEDGENAFPLFFDCPSATPIDQLPKTDSVFPEIWADNLDVTLGKLQQALKLDVYSDMSFNPSRIDYPEDIIVFASYTHKIHVLRPLFKGKYAHYKNMETPEILRLILDSKLVLSNEIKARLSELKEKNFSEKMIGVHVRYTDIKIPLEKLIDAVKKIQSRQQKATIFLATDSQEVIRTFEAEFASLVIAPKWFPPEGQRMHQNWDACPDRVQNGIEALTDLFLLSECQHLVFSSKSSFGYVASLLSKASPRNIYDVEINRSLMPRISRKFKKLLGQWPVR